MDVFRIKDRAQELVQPSLDPRLQPTPDYGTLGPGSDFAKSGLLSPVSAAPVTTAPAISGSKRRPGANLRVLHLVAMLVGFGAAFLVSNGAGSAGLWERITGIFSPRTNSSALPAKFADRELDRQRPQKQAEILLERAVSRSDGAADQIEARVDSWRGKLKWDAQLGDLTTAALNSSDQSVRVSAIEVQLAAYGLKKTPSSVDRLVRQADSSDHAQKVWALWSLGLLGNRGVETERAVQVLTAHLRDSDEEARRWAVEGLALVGTTPTIVPLLQAMHNDPSAMVRERAACSLAESGMLSHEQRLAAVPQLITYSDDSALDAQTRAWAFQALADITKQRLPNDSAAWRNWYATSVVSDQWPVRHARSYRPLTTGHWPLFSYSAILATCTSKPVLGSSDVSENALNPSPLTSV